jgi:iron complex transport system ATP-binding protein
MLREGRIFADGPKDELLTEATLAELFGVSVSVARRDGFYHVW